MNNIKDKAKYLIGRANRCFWTAASFFIPMNNKRIMFDSFIGKQYSCNPRAIYEYLLENTDDLEFIWAFKDGSYRNKHLNNSRTVKCRYRSLRHYYYMITSRCIVYNWKIPYDMPVRKSQLLIQTWHGGGCYKKAGVEIKENSDFHSKRMVEEINQATYYISSSEYFSQKVIREQNCYKGRILPIGMPRNDVLFNSSPSLKINIRKKLRLSDDAFVVLYAPTYRESMMDKNFDALNCRMLREVIKEKTGRGAVILYRGHHNNTGDDSHSFDKNVSDYFDMQDLLLISDMLISDYSSSIWDYSFTYRPCFLYTPDLKEYEEARGFDEDIHTWGFPVCISNDELSEKIRSFSADKFRADMDAHHNELGSYENGNATKKVCSLITKYLKKERNK